MKKTSRFILSWLFAFVALITVSFGANAQNRIYLEDFTIKDYNPVEVKVMLDNDVPVAGMQFHVEAKGLKVLGIKGTDRLTSGQKIDTKALPFVLIYGSTTFTGDSGAIATIEVQAEPGTFSQENPELSLTIYNIIVSQLGGIEVPMNTSATAEGTLDKDVIPYKVLPAQGYDKVTLVEGEETTIVLDLDAIFPPHSNQAFITLPEGVKFVENSVAKGSACTEGAEAFTFYQENNGRWSVLIANSGGFAFDSGQGSLFSFNVIAQNGAPENGKILINSEGTEKVSDTLYIPYTSSCEIEFTCEEPVEETSVWVVGNGNGMTWDLPGQEYTGENGIFMFDLKGVSAFKVSTVKAADWDTFNANAYATGNANFSDKVGNAGGETLPVVLWGANQDLPWTGDYSITLNLNDMSMTAYTTTPKPVTAPDVYIRGNMNNWLNNGPQEAWKFTNVSWDSATDTGEFTLNCSINAGVTFKIADMDWGTVNYGIGTNQSLNQLIKLNYGGSDISLAQDFNGTITFKITGTKSATVIFEMEGPAKDPEQFYVIGTLEQGAWNPTIGVKMVNNGEGIYTAEKVVLEESGGFTGFTITANLGANDTDWSAVNAFRFGPTTADAEAIIGTNTDLALNENSWSITPGAYKMTFDYHKMVLTIEAAQPESVPAESITIDSVTIDEPSYSSSDKVTKVTEGESVTMGVTVLPENTTDETTVTADNEGVTITDNGDGTWTIDTSDVVIPEGEKSVDVKITVKAGDVEEYHTLTVKAVLLGDSNDNGRVTIADVVTTANYMVGKKEGNFCFPNANVMLAPTNAQGEQAILPNDLVATINIVLNTFDGERYSQQEKRNVSSYLTNDRLVADNFNAGNSVIGINLENSVAYTALQATIELPAGMKIESVTTGQRAAKHELVYNVVGNELNVVLFSYDNASFTNGEGSLFNISVSADDNSDNLVLTNIFASDFAANGYELSGEGGRYSESTGIDGIGVEESGVRYFTVDGIEVMNPEKGQLLIRVQDGKAAKVLLK